LAAALAATAIKLSTPKLTDTTLCDSSPAMSETKALDRVVGDRRVVEPQAATDAQGGLQMQLSSHGLRNAGLLNWI
jgi:hypothetical protein